MDNTSFGKTVVFQRLQIRALRCLDLIDLRPGPGLNVLVGSNGAGKTSVLEAMYLLSHGRSFRSGSRDVVVQRGASTMQIYAEMVDKQNRSYRLGLGREGGRWDVHIDGQSAGRLGDLLRQCAVVCFEPGSHALISGGAEERRQFMDWGVFHVEHAFLPLWQRYRRAWRQRNALLRSGDTATESTLHPWDLELDLSGAEIDTVRNGYLTRLEPGLQALCRHLVPELGVATLRYRRGWDANRRLLEVLHDQRERDSLRGHNAAGPHRADWQLVFEHAPQKEHLSRGQGKLCALACLLAQAALHAEEHGNWPVLCLDDLSSELDRHHEAAVLSWLPMDKAQIFITGTRTGPRGAYPHARWFHVEQGEIEEPGGRQ